MRLFAGGLFLPEIASQTLFYLTPGQIESRAVETLGPLAKYSALIGAVIANIILYGLISLLSISSNRLYNRLRSRVALFSSSSSSEMIPIAGVAFAGDRGIAKVEVSTDGGTTWKDARLKDPLSSYTWVLWATGVNATSGKGNNHYKIIARAMDKTGKVQTTEIADPFPNGATGLPVINV